jgi:hypothetical protein
MSRKTAMLIVVATTVLTVGAACERRDGDGDTTVRIRTGTDTIRDTLRDTIRDTIRVPDTTR